MKSARFSRSLTISIAPSQFNAIKTITDKDKISFSEWFRQSIDLILSISDDL